MPFESRYALVQCHEYSPEQFSPSVPSELVGVVRAAGTLTHSVPPWNGALFGPWLQTNLPTMLLRTLVQRMKKSSGPLSDGVPEYPIIGSHPRLFVLASQ